MFKKFLLVVVVLIIGLCIFTGCSSGQAIEFRVGTVFGTGGEKTITKIVGSLANLSDSDIAGVISVDEKYDAVFFENNSLVIVAFATKTGGAQIEEISLIKKGNCLNIDIIGLPGLSAMVDQVVVVLEVTKENIGGAKKVKFTTNLNKL